MSKAVPNLLESRDTDRIQDEVGKEIRKTFAKSRKLTLPVKDITIPNDYWPLDYDKFTELLPDFEANGIKERIEVHERGSQYILLHGRLRLEAAKRLRLDEIKAVVFSDEYYKPKASRVRNRKRLCRTSEIWSRRPARATRGRATSSSIIITGWPYPEPTSTAARWSARRRPA